VSRTFIFLVFYRLIKFHELAVVCRA